MNHKCDQQIQMCVLLCVPVKAFKELVWPPLHLVLSLVQQLRKL